MNEFASRNRSLSPNARYIAPMARSWSRPGSVRAAFPPAERGVRRALWVMYVSFPRSSDVRQTHSSISLSLQCFRHSLRARARLLTRRQATPPAGAQGCPLEPEDRRPDEPPSRRREAWPLLHCGAFPSIAHGYGCYLLRADSLPHTQSWPTRMPSAALAWGFARPRRITAIPPRWTRAHSPTPGPKPN